MADIQINDQEIQDALADLVRALGNINLILMDIGESLTESTKQRFASHTGPNGERWPDNSPVTIERKGRNDPLNEWGTLQEQIEPLIIGDNAMAVNAHMEYAAMQQFGGTKGEFPHLWGNIPARPFLGFSNDDRENILDILSDALREAVD